MQPRERLDRGGNEGQVGADAQQVRIQRKAATGDTRVHKAKSASAEG